MSDQKASEAHFDARKKYRQMNRKDKARRQARAQGEARSAPEATPAQPGSSSSSSWQSVRNPSSSDFTDFGHPTAPPSQVATTPSSSCPSSLSSSFESLSLADAGGGAAPPGLASLTCQGLAQHTRMMRGEIQRRQFHCPSHGVFFKKVQPKADGRCVARCKHCNSQALKAAAAAAGEIFDPGRRPHPHEATLGPRLEAVPWAEERGRGLFVCRSCGGTWTSNRACRSLGQWCVHEGCAAAAAAAGSGTENGQIPGELPTEIRPVEPAWHRNRRMGGGGGRQPRHQEEDGPALPSVDEQRPFTGDGGVFTGGDGGCAEFGGPPMSGGGAAEQPEAGGRRSRARGARNHWCSGCSAGLCKLPPPQSNRHYSTGSTQATPSVATFSSSGSAFSAGSVQTRAR